jgi:hypothetical protein
VLQHKGFLGCEDLIQIVGTGPNPEVTMIFKPLLEVGIAQIGLFLGNIFPKGRLVGDV